jgi:hypothetical protein
MSDQEERDGQGTWHVWGREEVHTGFLVGKADVRSPLERTSCRWEDNNKMDLREVRRGNGVDRSGSE